MTRVAYNPPSPYVISGTGPYASDFAYLATDEIVVEVHDASTITALVLDTDFTVAPASTASTGDITLSAGAASTHAGKNLVIRRSTEIEQGWEAQAGPREAGLETQLDRLTQAVQEYVDAFARTIKLPSGDAGSLTADRANKYLMFDASGLPIAVASIDALAVTPFMETLVDDADAATARTTLGIGTIATQPNTQIIVGSDQTENLESITISTIGHRGDGGKDSGLAIKSYEPSIVLIDKSVLGGSALIQGTETGGLLVKGDTENDNTIGFTANATDYDLVRFETGTHTFYISGASKMTLTSAGLNIGATGAISGISTDDTLAADSDTLVPSQSAVKGYVDTRLVSGVPTNVTISGGAIDVSGLTHVIVDTEGGAATDTLDQITGGTDGQRLIIQITHNSRTVTLAHQSYPSNPVREMVLAAGVNHTLDSIYKLVELKYMGGLGPGPVGWQEISRSANHV